MTAGFAANPCITAGRFQESVKEAMRPNDLLEHSRAAGIQIPESPKAPMEFLSRTWSVSALEVSRALSTPCIQPSKSASSSSCTTTASLQEGVSGDPEELAASLDQFSFTSSAASQFFLDRIMFQQEISPLTSGRLSHSSGPLVGAGGCLPEDSLPASPSEEFEDVVKYFRSHNTLQPLFTGSRLTNAGNSGCNTPGARGKTVGRWLKERKEKKKEETRAHNAQLHAAVSVAAVASAIAAIAAGTAASSASEKDEQLAKTDMALASAATLVAAQCVEAAEVMGAERDHLASVVSSAVKVRSHDDIATLTAAAATALRGAATLKARALKEVWNAASVIPHDRAAVAGFNSRTEKEHPKIATHCGRGNNVLGEDLLGVFNEELLSRGAELLKRTRQGDLHWKVVSVYIHRTGQVMLKMKSKHVAGTITKKKKNIVLEVCKNMAAWPGRRLIRDGEQRRYFGLRTENRGMVEFECRSQREYEMWTQGVSRLLFMVAASKNKRFA